MQKPGQVFADCGIKQVGRITSAERGENKTMCACITAIGQAFLPAFIFSRVHHKDHMLKGAQSGSLGLACQSGWMNNELFVKSFFLICDSCRKSAVMLDRISLGRFLCMSGFLWLLYGLNGAWYGVRLGLSVLSSCTVKTLSTLEMPYTVMVPTIALCPMSYQSWFILCNSFSKCKCIH